MRGIISAFADQSIQNELKRDIENQDMAFMCDDCTNGVTLVMDVERHSDVDVIIMRYTAIKDIETYIAQIRNTCARTMGACRRGVVTIGEKMD